MCKLWRESYSKLSAIYIKAQSRYRSKEEKKLRDKKGKEKTQVQDASKPENKETEKSTKPNTIMDLKNRRWSQSSKAEVREFEGDKSRDYTEDY